jgi:amino acid permease
LTITLTLTLTLTSLGPSLALTIFLTLTSRPLFDPCCQAYIAHYNAPRFYQGLKDRSVARFSALSAMAFGVSIVVFASMMAFGFLTFGSATKVTLDEPLTLASGSDLLTRSHRLARG